MSVPRKYRQLGDFHKYYSGKAVAPVLTVVIGGNHEASNYLFELYYGGWLAPKIYYLGAAGVLRYGPWRIAGISGIYDRRDYKKAHHERLPYSSADIRSIYHVRRYDVDKLLRLRDEVDIGLSHDWPAWVELFGDYQALYTRKPHFFESAKVGGLGSYAATEVMNHIRPLYWFSGHMHCKFEATVRYTSTKMEDSIRQLKIDDRTKSALPVFTTQSRYFTAQQEPTSQRERGSFLALDKYKDNVVEFVEVMELDLPRGGYQKGGPISESGYKLHYDEEWLAITRAYAGTLRLQNQQTLVVPPAKTQVPSIGSISKHRTWVAENISAKGLLEVPENFVAEAPVYSSQEQVTYDQPREYSNHQTLQLERLLQIPSAFAMEQAENTGTIDSDDAFIVFEDE